MKFEDVREKLAVQFSETLLIHCTRSGLHRVLYDFIVEHRPTHCLELGFLRGVSSAFIAAALQENGGGHLITIDKKDQFSKLTPSIYDVLGALGLENYVTPIVADTSYNWELMKMIEANTLDNVCRPIFDFCFIDGAHTWETDGFAFFLVEKLLERGAWIMFDDYAWSYEIHLWSYLRRAEEGISAYDEYAKCKKFVESLPDDQQKTKQIGKVVDLLARQHPKFDNFNFYETKNLVWCQKVSD